MKVSSPIGDLPFKPTQIKLQPNGLKIEGSMGAWPADVQLGLADLPDILYLLRYVILFTLMFTGLAILMKRKNY